MISWDLDFVVKAVHGKVLSRVSEKFEGLATDTRVNINHKLFIALKGEQFDAHRFLAAAVKNGAAALVVHEQGPELQALAAQVTVVVVPDTLLALQSLAKAYRKTFVGRLVGIAGSNGKTTSKEFTAAVLSAGGLTHWSKGSFNNHWGVPFTLLATPKEAQFAVVEMGMNHAGELALLTEIAQPDVAVVTYVGVEHIEHFGTLEKIAEAESEIYQHAGANATRIYNLDNLYTQQMHAHHKKSFPHSPCLTFSSTTAELVDVSLQIAEVTVDALSVTGRIGKQAGQARVPIFGSQNLTNLMVAASSALAVGMSPVAIWAALPLCRTVWGRNQRLVTALGTQILFDGYNSNPDSMAVLMDNLKLLHTSGRKFGVFAEMRELGHLSAQMHEETGYHVGKSDLHTIWFYGKFGAEFASGVRRAGYKGELQITDDFETDFATKLVAQFRSDDIVVVKGSRGLHLERFVKAAGALDFAEKT